MRIAFFVMTLACIALAAATKEEALQSLSGNSEFTADLYEELTEVRDDNIALSPYSARTILSLTHEAARGGSARELADVLHLPDQSEKIRLEFKSDYSDNYTKNANKIYVANDVQIDDDFKNNAIKYFSADIENIDFNDNVRTASEINKWVEERTENRIEDLVNPTTIDKDTKILLVNTLLVNGRWTYQFPKASTTSKKFHTSQHKDKYVDMMQQTEFLRYHESSDLNAKFLELSYLVSSGNMSMVFVLPNEIDGLPNLERKMKDILAQQPLKEQEVVVEIPKFTVNDHIRMNPLLQNLGIKDVFSEEDADLSGFSSTTQNLFISDVIQKAFIEVNEDGTVAAPAASVIVKQNEHGRPRRNADDAQSQFIADHPFIYFILRDGVIVFAGRYIQ